MENPFRYFNSSPEVDPPRGDDVHPLSAVTEAGRRTPVRAWYRYLPRSSSVLVEPVPGEFLLCLQIALIS